MEDVMLLLGCYPEWNDSDVTLLLLCVCRLALSSMDMEQRDYDSRTALHVAAAEGKTHLYSAISGFVASKLRSRTSAICWIIYI